VARLTTYLKSRLYQITQWQAVDAIYSVSEFRFKLWNWKSERRFVVVREQLQTNKPAVGRKLIDLLGYVFRVFVTNRNDSALEIWRRRLKVGFAAFRRFSGTSRRTRNPLTRSDY
jgi:hypothetical protein